MNKIKYEINDTKLKLGDGKEERIISFNFPIRQLIEFPGCFVIRLEPTVGQVYNENVFGISDKGKILWQIDSISHFYEDSPYTGMGKEGNLIKLCNWDGTDLTVDPYTGKIIKKSFSK